VLVRSNGLNPLAARDRQDGAGTLHVEERLEPTSSNALKHRNVAWRKD
jgi:hypothetical protein